MDCVFGICDVVFSAQSPPTKLLIEWMRPFSATESHLAVKIILVIDTDNYDGGENKNVNSKQVCKIELDSGMFEFVDDDNDIDDSGGQNDGKPDEQGHWQEL